ncbi:unnamed protein product [Linum trigynum]|uniref:Uncharacterized protein n=1 Tax=Linum trigynum TaxID=586398 RepID=A0AAV2ECC7_9ROSI
MQVFRQGPVGSGGGDGIEPATEEEGTGGAGRVFHGIHVGEKQWFVVKTKYANHPCSGSYWRRRSRSSGRARMPAGAVVRCSVLLEGAGGDGLGGGRGRRAVSEVHRISYLGLGHESGETRTGPAIRGALRR